MVAPFHAGPLCISRPVTSITVIGCKPAGNESEKLAVPGLGEEEDGVRGRGKCTVRTTVCSWSPSRSTCFRR